MMICHEMSKDMVKDSLSVVWISSLRKGIQPVAVNCRILHIRLAKNAKK